MKFSCHYCGSTFTGSSHGNAKNIWCSENCRKRACDARRRPSCEECGASISLGATRCIDCEFRAREAGCEARRTLIQSLWEDGLTMREIVARDDVPYATVNALGVELHRMKKNGWTLSVRRPGWKGHDRAAGPAKVVKDVYSPKETHNRVYHALVQGEITKPDSCERCGVKGYLHGHHADYSKPLEVEWICPCCHAQHHADERRIHPAPMKATA